ncbi:MAG: lyase family protein [Candidatus Paceibacterota bacterium]
MKQPLDKCAMGIVLFKEEMEGGSVIERYADERITRIWSLLNKFNLWQDTEIAYLYAWEEIGAIPSGTPQEMELQLRSKPINEALIDEFDHVMKHDLNACLEEFRARLDEKYHQWLHLRMTSYDTEEPPFAIMIRESVKITLEKLDGLIEIFKKKASEYRHVPMMGRTHGMEGEPQSQGKRFLNWLRELLIVRRSLAKSAKLLEYSKGAGAMGNHADMDPRVEESALKKLGFKVCYGVGQIMPREIHAEIADALKRLAKTLAKIATDVRLGARSGADSIYQEPFGKGQLGSSAMPHKKNTITSEQETGLGRLATAYSLAIDENIDTWEERAIEQSVVERIAWPDLFHVVLRAILNMKKVISGLVVKTKNMLRGIIGTRGCYATNGATQFIRVHGKEHGITSKDAYRIVQLAAFNAFYEPDAETVFASIDEAVLALERLQDEAVKKVSIKDILSKAQLMAIPTHSATVAEVDGYNAVLAKIFVVGSPVLVEWDRIFDIRTHLENEKRSYQEMLGMAQEGAMPEE